MTFKNEEELRYFLYDACYDALESSLNMVYGIIDRFVKEFYADYSPELYERTYQLYRSLVKTEVTRVGNSFKGSVYFDYTSLEYFTGMQPSGEQVMDAAAWGFHGARELKMVYGEHGIGVWNDPMQIISKDAIEILKENLISYGVPIK